MKSDCSIIWASANNKVSFEMQVLFQLKEDSMSIEEVAMYTDGDLLGLNEGAEVGLLNCKVLGDWF